MKRCILWGLGQDYEELSSRVQLEVLKENISIVAIICKNRITDNYDGYKVITSEMLSEYEYDYIIIMSTKYFVEIKQEIIDKGIDENRVINGRAFRISNFDFGRYIALIENPITILTEDCMGGYLYNYLGLRCSSPTINTLFDVESYAIFVSNFMEYINKPLVIYRGQFKKNEYPIGIIKCTGGGKNQICSLHRI